MRLGFVGVGKWAQKLASAFRACGAEIVAYDRSSPVRDGFHARSDDPNKGPLDYDIEFGVRTAWRHQLADKSIDAIIAAAPPDVTTEVALSCAAAGKPVMATKPLWNHPERITAPFYVDFWRLWSAAFLETKAAARAAMAVPYVFNYERTLASCGPFRGFPGGLDYGPHVMAEVIDIFGDDIDGDLRLFRETRGEGEILVGGRGGPFSIRLEFGNGASASKRAIGSADGRQFEEDSLRIGPEEKSAVLQRFCQSFLNDISEGFVDTRLLELSRRGMEELRKVRGLAK